MNRTKFLKEDHPNTELNVRPFTPRPYLRKVTKTIKLEALFNVWELVYEACLYMSHQNTPNARKYKVITQWIKEELLDDQYSTKPLTDPNA